MKKHWIGSLRNFTKNCLDNMIAVAAEIVVKCTIVRFHKEEMEKSAVYFNMTEKEFIDAYLMRKDEYENEYKTKHIPCDFLNQDGTCKLGECKPENCKKYPYTSQPERLHSLYSVLEAVEVCSVAFEIYERLKNISFLWIITKYFKLCMRKKKKY